MKVLDYGWSVFSGEHNQSFPQKLFCVLDRLQLFNVIFDCYWSSTSYLSIFLTLLTK